MNNSFIDLPIYIPAIEENIEANLDTISSEISARNIDWTEDVSEDLTEKADVVFVCDCVYYDASLEPLTR